MKSDRSGILCSAAFAAVRYRLPGPKCRRGSTAGCGEPFKARLCRRLLGEPFVEPPDIDDHSLVTAAPDFLGLVARAHRELDAAPLDLGDFRLGADLMTGGGRGEVPDVDRGSDRGFAGVEKAADGIERGVLHREDHDRGGEHVGEHRILEPAGEVLGSHAQREAAPGTYGNRAHALLAISAPRARIGRYIEPAASSVRTPLRSDGCARPPAQRRNNAPRACAIPGSPRSL